LWVRPGNGWGSWQCLRGGVAGLRGVWPVAERLRAHLLYRMPPSHRRTISRRSGERRLSTIKFPFSSGKSVIDHLILRLETYPQDGGTRPAPETSRGIKGSLLAIACRISLRTQSSSLSNRLRPYSSASRSQFGPMTTSNTDAVCSALFIRFGQSSPIRIASVSMNTLDEPKTV